MMMTGNPHPCGVKSGLNDGSAMISAYESVQGEKDDIQDESNVIDLKKRAQK